MVLHVCWEVKVYFINEMIQHQRKDWWRLAEENGGNLILPESEIAEKEDTVHERAS